FCVSGITSSVNSGAAFFRTSAVTVSVPPPAALTSACSGAVGDTPVAPFAGDSATGAFGAAGFIVYSKSVLAQLVAPSASVTFTFQNHVPGWLTVALKLMVALVPDNGCETTGISAVLNVTLSVGEFADSLELKFMASDPASVSTRPWLGEPLLQSWTSRVTLIVRHPV